MDETKKVGILDDRTDTLETTEILIGDNLDPGWGVVRVALLPTPKLVVDWLINNNVKVLVVDQNLTEQQQVVPITYSGHQVVKEIRAHIPDLPVYMVTAFGDRSDVAVNKGKMDEVVDRNKFNEDVKIYVERMMRAGEVFDKRWKDALARLSSLSQKRAGAKLSKEDEKELKALQAQLDLLDVRESQDNLLLDLGSQIGKLSSLQVKAEQLLKQNKVK